MRNERQVTSVIKQGVIISDNAIDHITARHPYMTEELIRSIVRNPDYVYKRSYYGSDFFYEKKINGYLYRVVVCKNKLKGKGKSYLITGYLVDQIFEISVKQAIEVYRNYRKVS